MLEQTLIQEALADQQIEAQKILASEHLIERDLTVEMDKIIASPMIKVITGVRRCGKSVLALQIVRNQNFVYLNFDDERLIGVRARDLSTILKLAHQIRKDCKTLVLDEIQNVFGWELFVNRLKRQGYNIIVTGSNAKLLSRELATHLTGRHLVIELWPFSFKEYLRYYKVDTEKKINSASFSALITKNFNDYWLKGGFPEIYEGTPSDPYLRELFQKIVTRDIVLRYELRHAKLLTELATYLIGMPSTTLTYQSLKRVFQMKSVGTVKNYLSYFEDCYLIKFTESFFTKAKERISMPRKMYTIDTALSAAFSPRANQDLGAKLENLVFLELVRRQKNIMHLKRPGYEIDFVILKNKKPNQLIQVCYDFSNPKTEEREVSALIKGAHETGSQKLLILTFNQEVTFKRGPLNFVVTPIWKWLAGIEEFGIHATQEST